MWQFIRDVCSLTFQWWQADRPRVSGRAGRLLRIEPPAILSIGSHLAEVLGRSVSEDATDLHVVYHCQNSGQPCKLFVKPFGIEYQCHVRWICGGTEHELEEDEVEVFQAR